MIAEIISALNATLKFPIGSKTYGIAQSVIRKTDDGSQLLPCTVDKNGDYQFVGIDNTLPVSLYHKTNSIQIKRNGKGVGDSIGEVVNTYSNAMIVYLDTKKAGVTPDELLLQIQNSFPDAIRMQPYKNIVITFLNVILNSTQVWASEYQNTEYELLPETSLFAINYQIESTFKKGCFDNCS